MEKTNINRLLRVFVPFIIMVMAQNLLLLIFGRAGMSGTVPSLTAFLAAAMAAILLFFLYNYESTGEEWKYSRKNSVPKDVMYFFFTVASLILAMYLVSVVMLDYQENEITVTPLYLVSLLLVHPVLEEYIFRGLFYSELRKINPIFGITAQAIMFAIIHSTVDGMIYALISGIFLGFAMEKTQRLWVPIAAHIFINVRSLAYLTILAENESLRQTVDTAFVSVGAISILILICIRGRRAVEPESSGAESIAIIGSEEIDDE